MNHNRRSYAMDGLKLLFMLLIVVHHSSYYYDRLHHAYMAVDLFFMISGYLLIRTLRAKPQMGVGGYFLSRICKLYPHYLLSFAAIFLSTSVYKSGTITPAMLLRALPEILLVQNLGIFGGGVNYPCWYLSVLVFAGVLVFFLGRKLPQCWFNALAVICAAVPYSCILHSTGGSMETFATVGMFYLPLLFQTVWTWLCAENKLLSQYATGVWWMYPLTSYLCGMIAGLNEHDRCVSYAECGFASILMLLGGLILCYYATFHAFIAEYAVVICYMIYVIRLLINEEHPLCNMMSNKYLVMIGSLSFEIYLIHIPVTRFFEFFGFSRSGLVTFCIIVATTILFAFIWQKMMSHLSRGKKWKIL